MSLLMLLLKFVILNLNEMVKEITMYTVVCNKCGKDVCENSEYAGWSDKKYVNDIARDDLWFVDEVCDNHYCSECYEESTIIDSIETHNS